MPPIDTSPEAVATRRVRIMSNMALATQVSLIASSPRQFTAMARKVVLLEAARRLNWSDVYERDGNPPPADSHLSAPELGGSQ